MDNHYQIAVALILCAERIITDRKGVESLCGYPDTYGGDTLLLKKMREFLSAPSVQLLVDEITKNYPEV